MLVRSYLNKDDNYMEQGFQLKAFHAIAFGSDNQNFDEERCLRSTFVVFSIWFEHKFTKYSGDYLCNTLETAWVRWLCPDCVFQLGLFVGG